MSTLADRLQILRGARSRRFFADILFIKESTLRNYEQGASLPNSDVLARICITCNVNPDWLLLGNGPMSRDAAPQKVCGPIDEDKLAYAVETAEGMLEELGKELTSQRKAQLFCSIYTLVVNGDESVNKPVTILRYIKGAAG